MTQQTQGAMWRRGTGLSAPVLALLAVSAPQAFAQDVQLAQAAPAPAATPAAKAKAEVAKAQAEEVVVTGSRIRQPNLTSVSPMTVVNNAELKLSGYTGVEELVNQLPQAFIGQTQNQSIAGTGTATVDLRGLGCYRTLVLVDGKRMVPGDPIQPCADLNTIPAIAIDRVDVVTGGASSTYGADAVAGVVNFVTKKNFEGLKADFDFSTFDHENTNSAFTALLPKTASGAYKEGFAPAPSHVNDGHAYTAAFLMGANSENGRGNVTFFGQYKNTQPVVQSDRDYSACGVGDNGDGTYSCLGSGSPAATRIFVPDFRTANGTTVRTAGSFTVTGSGTLIPYVGSRDSYNFAAASYYQRQDDRYNFGVNGHYEISKAFDAYAAFGFTDDHTLGNYGPVAVFTNAGPVFPFNCANPYLTAQQRSIFPQCVANPNASFNVQIGRRMVEAGPRQNDFRHTSYSATVGMRGDIGKAWNYDVYGEYSTTLFTFSTNNDQSVVREQRAMDVVSVNGVPTCRSVVNGTDPNCVPINLFSTTPLTPAALKYLSANFLNTGSTNEQIVSGTLSGDLGTYGLKSPFATDGVRVAFGGEYRRDSLNLLPDVGTQTGDSASAAGSSVPANKGAYDVQEGYIELKAPLVQDKFLIKSIAFDSGYRYSSYSLQGQTEAYKFGLEYSPVDDIRFRTSYNKAVRVPNAVELFTPQAFGLFNGNDPCAGPTPTFSLAQCQLTGVTASQYKFIQQCSANQCAALSGGNPALKPENATTKTIGFVATPSMVPGLNLSFDYFFIRVTNYIQNGLDGTLILTQCATAGSLCNLIKRDPTTGAISFSPSYVQTTYLNSGSQQTSGYDLGLNYATDLPAWIKGGAGSIRLSYKATILKSLVTEPIAGLGKYDCAGFFGTGGCNYPSPEYRHTMRFTWESPWDIDGSVNWRYLGGTKFTGNTTDPFYGNSPSIVDGKIPDVNYIDLTATYRWNSKLTVRAGANNVFDKDPPVISSGNSGTGLSNGNIYAGRFDCCGRQLFVGATVNF